MSLIFKGIYLGGGGGGSANLTTLDVTPMTNYQSISPEEGYDGFSLVNVSAVNSSIDPNITAGNIVNGVNILGVVGSYAPVVENLDVTPMTSAQSFVPNVGVTGFNMVNVSEVNSSIDPNITASNIVNGVNILGVVGTASASAPKEVARYVIRDNGAVEVSDADITGKFESINSVANYAMEYAFYNTQITGNACFLNCTNVGNNAFINAFTRTNITNLCFPNATNVNSYAFFNAARYCNNINEVNFCNLRYANTNSFESAFGNSTVNTINFNKISHAYNSAFAGAFTWTRGLKTAYFANLKYVHNSTFTYAFWNSELESFDAPSLVELNGASFQSAFLNAKNFKYFNIPATAQGAPGWGMTNAFRDAFAGSGLISFSFHGNIRTFPNVFNNAFSNCPNLVSVNLSSEKAYNTGGNWFRNACRNCPNLVSVDLSFVNRTEDYVSAGDLDNAFRDDVNLTTVNLSSLRGNTLGNALQCAFYGCSNLREMEFPLFWWAPQTAYFNNAFANSGIQNLSFSGMGNFTYLTNNYHPFGNMLKNVDGCTVHFPAEAASAQTQTDFIAGFGGTNTTILFDLPNVVTGFANFYNITGNGEMGGQTIAVNASSENADAYLAMSQDTATGWHSAVSEAPHYYTIYCPEGMQFENTSFFTSSAVNVTRNTPQMINVCVSNDGSNWSEVNCNFTGSGGYANTAFLKPGYYKYYKFYFNSYSNNPSYITTINKITLTGTHKYR